MEVIYGKLGDILNPDANVIVIKIGDTILIRHYDPTELLKTMREKFKELSDDEKEKLAIEAKKWAREGLS